MSNQRISRHVAEQLLCDTARRPAGVQPALLELLAAAAGPARPDELAGAARALAAFRSAPPHRTEPPTAEATGLMRRLRQLLTAKVVAIGAATTIGSAALAGSAGALSEQLPSIGPRPTLGTSAGVGTSTGPGASAPGRSGANRPDSGSDFATPSGSGPTSQPGEGAAIDNGSPDGSDPAATLAGRCRAYQSGGGGSLSNPAFQTLISAAGGADRIDGYCAQLLGPDGHPGAGQGGGSSPQGGPGQPKHATPGGQPTRSAGRSRAGEGGDTGRAAPTPRRTAASKSARTAPPARTRPGTGGGTGGQRP